MEFVKTSLADNLHGMAWVNTHFHPGNGVKFMEMSLVNYPGGVYGADTTYTGLADLWRETLNHLEGARPTTNQAVIMVCPDEPTEIVGKGGKVVAFVGKKDGKWGYIGIPKEMALELCDTYDRQFY
jgi:hypothetical protein